MVGENMSQVPISNFVKKALHDLLLWSIPDMQCLSYDDHIYTNYRLPFLSHLTQSSESKQYQKYELNLIYKLLVFMYYCSS
jgi:hypothetical protein